MSQSLWMTFLRLRPKSQVITCMTALTFCGCHLFSSGSDEEKGKDDDQVPQVSSTLESTSAKNTSSKPKEDSTQQDATNGQIFVARVNGVGIPESDFLREYEERVRTYRVRKREVPPRLEYTYKLSVLNQLINDSLVRQELERTNMSLTEDELNLALNLYKARFRSEKNFQNYLAQSNKTLAETIESVRFDALLEKLISKDLTLKITEEELNNSYQEQKTTRYTEPAKAKVRHILISVPQNAPKKSVMTAKRLALQVTKKARLKDANFANLAKEFSQDQKSKTRGGDLGLLVKKGDIRFSDAFEKVASNIPLHTPSEPVLSPQGWHILKVTDRQPEQLRVSQILLKGPQAKTQAQDLLKRAFTEPFADLARTSSQDEASRVRGGDLDFLHPKTPHRFGEKFKEGIFKLKRGDLSVVESAQGVHVVFITDSRPMRVRVSHILLSIPKDAKQEQIQKLKTKANQLHDELQAEIRKDGLKSNIFTRLARKHSDDLNSNLRGGDIGPFFIGGEPHFSHEVEDVMFSLAVNQVSDPVRSPFGWHILKVEQQIPKYIKSLSEVRAELTEQLASKTLRRQKALFMQRLKSEAKIDRYLDLKKP